jgi:hypothetical protein
MGRTELPVGIRPCVIDEAYKDAVGSLAATERVINHRKARKLGLGLKQD